MNVDLKQIKYSGLQILDLKQSYAMSIKRYIKQLSRYHISNTQHLFCSTFMEIIF